MLTRNEVTGEWRRLHKELLNDLYCSADQCKKSEIGGACSTLGESCVKRKPEGKRILERPKNRWENEINMDHQEMGWGTDGIDLAQNRNR